MPEGLPQGRVPDEDLEQVTGGVGWQGAATQLEGAVSANYKGEASESGIYNMSNFAAGGRPGRGPGVLGTFK